MKKLALIGKGISHSRSQEVYESILKERVDYALLDIPSVEKIPRLEVLFDTFDGISITAPYKNVFFGQVLFQETLPGHLNSINCVRKNQDRYEGTSTDFLALREHFDDLKRQYKFFRVALLGDGNMSAMTRFILDDAEVEHRTFSRKLGNLSSDTNLTKIFPSGQQVVVVNACSREFVFRGQIPSGALFWDYNYNMGEHEQYWSKKNIYRNGYSLLRLQAKYALNFWYRG